MSARPTSAKRALLTLSVVMGVVACGDAGDPFAGGGDGFAASGPGDGTGNGGAAANSGSGGIVVGGTGQGGSGQGGSGTAATGGGQTPVDCDNPKLTAVVRDFRACSGAQWESGYIASCSSGHPDFETFAGDTSGTPCCSNMVESTLTDSRPVQRVAGPHIDSQWGQQTASAASFAQWYQDVDGVNSRVDTFVTLARKTASDAYGCTSAANCYVYDSDENQPAGFFPIDGQAFAESVEGEDGAFHNFWFTTEIHTEFEYLGGEVFTFSGDDDVWVFINERLAIDLGGLHPRREGSVDLDQRAADLEISVGGTYKLEIFHAERHTGASNFRIETTIECIQDRPPPK